MRDLSTFVANTRIDRDVFVVEHTNLRSSVHL